VNNHLLDEPFYVFLMFTVGQAVTLGALITGLFWLIDRLITAVSRRRKARRVQTAQPTTDQ
jgi:hypothetical protein